MFLNVKHWFSSIVSEVSDDSDEDQEAGDAPSGLEPPRGMRTERILRTMIKVPVRWFQNVYHAKKLEASLNKVHPECPIKVKVVDKLVGNPFIENTFDYGLIVIPCLFLFSFSLWAISRFTARWFFEPCALIAVVISTIVFLLFGCLFLFASFFGYEFEYMEARSVRRRRNYSDEYDYSKLA